MRLVGEERGVALITVVVIGAALTVLTSTAVFVAVHDFRAGTDDRKATEAVAYAEAGVDRMIENIRILNFGQIRQAGCAQPKLTLPEGAIGNGKFNVSLQVFNPTAADPANRYPIPPTGGACASGVLTSNPRKGQYFLISSTGEASLSPTAAASRRVIQQVVKVTERGLPVGLSADRFDGNGTPDAAGISILSEGQVLGRNKLDLTGLDAYYTLEDFWPGATWPAGLSGSNPAPAAVHSVGGNKLGNSNEFPPNPNCGANKTNSNKQSLWDSDGSSGSGTISSTCAGQPAGYTGAYPPTSKFTQADYDRVAPEELSPEDHAVLKRAAQDKGLYCYIPTTGSSYCIKQGTQIPYTTNVSSLAVAGSSFVAYFEFQGGSPSSNIVNFNTDVWTPGTPNGCSDDPALNRSMVMVIKNGSFDTSGNVQINGAIIADGDFDYHGTPRINGSIQASTFVVRGTANFSLDACWVRNIPGLYMVITPTQWSEIDR